jgi:AcrR family transcriptional regulator
MEYAVGPDRRQRKRQAIHQQLLDTAAELFRERGLGGTTIDDIAEAADVARQTIFNHFPSKEAFALELTSDGIAEVAARAQILLETGVPALEVLQRAAFWVLDTAVHDGELAVAAARELQHSDPVRAAHAAERLPLHHIFEAILTQAREEGSIRADLPLEIVAARLGATLRGLVTQVVTAESERLKHELAVFFDIVFNGIRDRSI